MTALAISILSLTDRINEEHRQCKVAITSGLEHAVECGRLLIEQKAELSHGEWIPWIEAHCDFSEQSARAYMQVSRMPKRQRVGDMSFREALKLLAEPAHVSHNSGQNEWYTPQPLIDAAKGAMGSINLDPASSEQANDTVQADTFYSESDNGLEQDWAGNVWMNPPYAQPLVAEFVDKCVSEFKAGSIKQACVLVNNATETDWFQKLLAELSAVCFPKGRIKFIDMDGQPSGAPLQGQAIIYMGDDVKRFCDEFSKLGTVLSCLKPPS